jgi:hypothetical protein
MYYNFVLCKMILTYALVQSLFYMDTCRPIQVNTCVRLMNFS